ncbi:MAG: DNA-directed RNA polymerase subunit beta [Patescibacteria group bacterium]|nr:DNA-directed RNA polymerase subunit beta [Patescibacteria group bacterium]MDD4304654.1 DNA-directed RNA polymerase subunit beta [Patescibacteria group bacterium]MDD4695705.1 DNA-directed RNA polymerase subunit beta [Patescibacteria group bacterium]
MSKKVSRKYFTESREAFPLLDLIEVQKDSYKWFFEKGLKELFEEISPIRDFTSRDLELYFLDYRLEEPKFDEVYARERNTTYEAPLRINSKLVNKRSGSVKEQEIYLGDFPLMTEKGTFIINGVERVVVSQLIRSAGVFFTSQVYVGRNYYGAKIIPNRGAWLEIETDPKKRILYISIDRKRKVPATALLRAFGYSTDQEIIDLFEDVDNHPEVSFIKNTLEKDISKNQDDGLIEIYKRIRPGDLATSDNAKSLIFSMFFDFNRYDLGTVGRYKLNKRFGQNFEITNENRTLKKEDLIVVMKEIIRLNLTQEPADDIDHLGNRRVRAVGELIQNRFRIGLARMERIIKDRMSTSEVGSLTPNVLINAKPVIGTIREFFMSSQLSQFMDQTNPLAELEHKRRLSALGPGGLSRERAGFEVRDVHRSHYGRICPIATPEGPNIGLVGHLASYARINEYGFLETPFRKVLHDIKSNSDVIIGKTTRTNIKDPKTKKTILDKGVLITDKIAKDLSKYEDLMIPIIPTVTDDIVYLDAFEEERSVTTAATTPVTKNGLFVKPQAEMRIHGQPTFDNVEEIDYMDIAPNQIISIATSLIPFLEHDDAVRALMGSNMQRQAVSLVKPEAPIVGTGIEARAAEDSGQITRARNDGEVVLVQSNKIIIKEKDNKDRGYDLYKFIRSNASTCMNQHPIVSKGEKVKRGDVIADGASVDNGELSLGRNVLVAYMPWEGGNFEDAILLSERLVKEDVYTSIHIEHYSMEVRDTKLGPEVITRDIPNIGEERLKDLDKDGIVRIGATVKSGDILVGKITPKGETELSAEEKLLRAIFGEKAKDVKDSSLYLEHGEHGKVVDIKFFSRKNGDKLSAGVIKTIQISVAQMRKIQVGDKMAGRHGNKGVVSRIIPEEDMPFMEDGTPVDIILNPLGIISRMNLGQVLETHLGLAARKLGYKVVTPPLNGVLVGQIKEELKLAGFPEDGKVQLFDGRTGEFFDNKTTVGISYMLKLNHLVEDKIHARSIGPYSLITQQPLGGKAQFGGQRFGEMEVWALEAYGAAYTLQEMLTIKSDDVNGRSKAYESIIKGEEIEKISIPESFNVLVSELRGLGINVEMLDKNGEIIKSEDKKFVSDFGGNYIEDTENIKEEID